MIKLSAGYSKKVPVDGVEYSSKQYSAQMEVETADSASDAVIKGKLQLIYAILEEIVEEKLHQTVAVPNGKAEVPGGKGATEPAQGASAGRAGVHKTNGHATEAQQRAIFAIARSLNMEPEELEAALRDRYEAGEPSEITLAEASSFIDWLKARQAEAVK